MSKHCAFLIIDVQNDFCPGGTLEVPEGDSIIPVLNQYIDYFESKNIPILVSRDWHPKVTRHFKQYGGQWPEHCVQTTQGADFHSGLNLPDKSIILSKGMDPEQDAYSVFQAIDLADQNFFSLLYEIEVKILFIGGLATEYCVQETVLDALKENFGVYLLLDGIKGIDPIKSGKSTNKMIKAGARPLTYPEFIKGEITDDYANT